MPGIALILLSLTLAVVPSFAQQGAETEALHPNYLEEATLGTKTLQSWYTQDTGLYQTTGWWNSANAITVLANYTRVSHDRRYLPVFVNTLQQAQTKYNGFLNNYYDDEGWWALAWIDAYDLTGNRQYLAMADAIFADMTKGWDNTCNGGIWWSKDRKYKNAIANELFLSVAANLAARTRNPMRRKRYATWAKREWRWFESSGMINSQHLINDGLDSSTCKNNQKDIWSYNQGVILDGLVELNRVDRDPGLPQMAQAIALAAIAHLTDFNEIMHDVCEPNCGADGVQFKGIFARNLMLLQSSFPDPRYKAFIDANARSIWNHAQGANYQFGQDWSGPFSAGNAGSQSSALDALVAAAAMEHPARGSKPTGGMLTLR